MGKIKTSPKRKAYSSKKQCSQRKAKPIAKDSSEKVFILKEVAVKEYDPVQNLLDTNKMGAAIMQCFIENDTEGVLEIIESYLYALNKTQFLKEAKVPRSTVYNFFKRRNPTIKTLAKIIHASAHS